MDSTTEAALLVADKVCMHRDMLTAQVETLSQHLSEIREKLSAIAECLAALQSREGR